MDTLQPPAESAPRPRPPDAPPPGAQPHGAQLLDAPLASAEFLAVDTETNGHAGESCEMTEVGAVLVGGGELHDRFASLVRVQLPLRRGIERFTGITQAMLDGAPEPAPVLSELATLLQGRVLVAHNAPFDRRVLRQAFARAGLDWPDPPVLCTAQLARRLLPLQRERKLGALADALGIEVTHAHRALPDAETCGRVLCALFPRLCAQATTVRQAVALLRAQRPRRHARPPRDASTRTPRDASTRTSRDASTRTPRDASTRNGSARTQAGGHRQSELPTLEFGELPRDPGVYLFRDREGRTLYVGKSVSVRTRARAHFAPSAPRAAWTQHAVVLDYRATCSELGALVLENRLIKQLHPPGNVRLRRLEERHVYLRCRLDIPFPVLEVSPHPAPGLGISVGPLKGRKLAQELVEQLDSLFGLRHCGRRLPRREHPSAYGQMGRCLSPCLGDLDPNLYRARLDAALALLTGASPGEALIQHVHRQMREAAGARRYERAAWLRRRARRLAWILRGLDGVLEATHTRPRLIVAPHPTHARADAFWMIGGRLRDWSELPCDPAEFAERHGRATALAPRGPMPTAHLPPDEVDEVRIISTYLSSHPELEVHDLSDPSPAAAPSLPEITKRLEQTAAARSAPRARPRRS